MRRRQEPNPAGSHHTPTHIVHCLTTLPPRPTNHPSLLPVNEVNVRHPHAQFPTIAFPNGNINAGVKSNRIGFELERNDEQ